jgi:hypothetical protein
MVLEFVAILSATSVKNVNQYRYRCCGLFLHLFGGWILNSSPLAVILLLQMLSKLCKAAKSGDIRDLWIPFWGDKFDKIGEHC